MNEITRFERHFPAPEAIAVDRFRSRLYAKKRQSYLNRLFRKL
jgi:hypothetical protein